MTQDTSEHIEKVRGYFDARVDDYDAFYDPPSAFVRWFNRVFRKAVYYRRNQVAVLAEQYGCRTVLDVGCGSARNAIWWARHGVEKVHGVDISAEMIEEAGRLADEAGVSEQCTFETLDFLEWNSDRKWDMAVACGVFDYVPDATDFLRHMSKFATRIVYGSFPGWTLVRTPLRKIRYSLRGCPTHFYRQGELEKIFADVGFGRMEYKAVPSGKLVWAVKD